MTELESLFVLVGSVTVIVLLISNIIKDFYIQKSIPVDKLPELFDRLRPMVERTATKVDDVLLDAAEDLVDYLPNNTATTQAEVKAVVKKQVQQAS